MPYRLSLKKYIILVQLLIKNENITKVFIPGIAPAYFLSPRLLLGLLGA